MRDHGKAVSVMTTAVDMDPSNTTLYLQLLDLHTSGPAPPDMPAAEALFAKVASSPHLSEEAKDSFLTRRQQLLEEFGGNFSESVFPHILLLLLLSRSHHSSFPLSRSHLSYLPLSRSYLSYLAPTFRLSPQHTVC